MSAAKLTPKEACALLGLAEPVGGLTLKLAFRAAAKASRPDHPGGDEERFRQVIEAYRLLQTLETARAVTAAPAPQPRPEPKPERPVLEITPTEAATGLARNVQLPDGRTLGLRLPAGLRAGETVRLAGQGQHGKDLLLTVRITTDGDLRVVGDDLWLEFECDASVLIHGGRVRVPTPSGERDVWVPRALPSPARLRLKDQGLPARDGRPQGHLFLTLKAAKVRASDPAADRLNRFRHRWAS
ncbi:J domain-containing protein [Brevundimonas sp.]|uniref:J domain-containing protein n=1 Tax=Brevundimonas sp. TaxID=1871086 RepID=UPI0025E6C3CD|nr:J domain-containing protein [Brevundimonas sp.]